MKLIYINAKDTSVAEAQVFSLLDYYKKKSKFQQIILLQGYRNKNEIIQIKKKLVNFDIDVYWFKIFPNYSMFNHFTYKKIRKQLDAITIDANTIIHVRGEIYGAMVVRYLKKKEKPLNLLVDIRGVNIEEIQEYYKRRLILKFDKINRFKHAYSILRQDIPITVVSTALKNYLITHHSFKEKNVCINPNISGLQFEFSQEKRNKIRKEYSITDEQIVAVISSSSSVNWQKDYKVIKKLTDLNVTVFNLSLHKVDLPQVINKKIDFNKMPSYLSAADIAVLWRDENIVNQVASPSKFSEFACMGLYVLHNATVQIATEYIQNTQSGKLYKNVDEIDLSDVNVMNSVNRQKFIVNGISKFGIENIAQSYIKKYNEIY